MSAVDLALSSPFEEESVRSSRHSNGTNESIVIYITVGGFVIPMRVLKCDSIASVKLRIQTCQGFVVKRQKLVFGGRELSRNDCLVKDYGVVNGNVVHLILKLSHLLIINVSTTCGKDFEFHVDRHQNVGYLKRKIAKEGKGYFDLEDKDLFCNGEKLEDLRLIDDINKNTADAVVHLVVEKSAKVWAKPVDRDVELSVVAANSNSNWNEKKPEVTREPTRDLQALSRNKSSPHGGDVLLEPIIVNPKVKLAQSLWDIMDSALDGLVKGKTPIRSSEGTGGTYLMLDGSGKKYVAVFKPIDEEPLAVNNPRELPLSSTGEGLKRGTRVGEGAFREVAAFLLDHPKTGPRSGGEIGFSGVPPTVMVQCLHNGFHYPDGFQWSPENIKIGSLQLFKSNYGNCEDIGPQDFPVEEVHKICILDIRTANADRHAGNILVSKGEDARTLLTPIDHGYCLPEKFEDCTFDWLYWPQARKPFSAEAIEYIKTLDAEEDIALLRFHGWELSLECARVLRISTMLLKKGAERGLNPFAIGSMMCRENLNKESSIEEIVREARGSKSETEFLQTVSELMDVRLESLLKKDDDVDKYGKK
ncbi:PREDICTED: phosphatidylinositol 4-kinase gamma 2-like isoform X2 [Ipomoea nil]|uniref:phosphatidylinositol 4-kinase gamma 2-like isoform X2 n=1 Tax=Ipomoea nil TaxID=35883 RepID=UPI00090095E5|nr:PREDICTED: phosphatidylinositol 4-kinase gamma 2-like isoform X2 [Ipomoea nil]